MAYTRRTLEYRQHRLKYHLFQALPNMVKILINLIMVFMGPSISDELYDYLMVNFGCAPTDKFNLEKLRRRISWWLKDTEFHHKKLKELGIYVGYKNKEWRVENPNNTPYCYDYDNCGDPECNWCKRTCNCSVCTPMIKGERQEITVSLYVRALSRKDLLLLCG